MLNIDWRAPAAYGHTNRIPAAGFAWEYLRRDDEYHRDFRAIARLKNPRRRLETFSHRWGLRFPVRSRNSS
ncbi:transcriptional regulator domain-containing protein [Acidomonas methanolica]|uniref:transcriptional regulator domain-containing protein n=1 Tax=Acidomonas methanolica TaxID=437 RepID=UPI0009E09CC2|nr:DUF6499 domain-containing protein [Acidomonas methanolica]MBU2653111.1 hypothetical protein [Acidomonas methanolica]